MAQREFTVDKDMTITKVKTIVKTDAMADLFEFYVNKYGEENVRWVRTGSGQSKTNDIAVKYAEATVNGEVVPVCFRTNASVPEFVSRETAKKVYTAFDFDDAALEYEAYIIEKADKAADAAKKKADKIEKDKERREKDKEKTTVEF